MSCLFTAVVQLIREGLNEEGVSRHMQAGGGLCAEEPWKQTECQRCRKAVSLIPISAATDMNLTGLI